MKDEKSKSYIIEPLFEHFNENHDLKPFGYQYLVNSLANIHLKDTNQGAGELLLGKFAWVLVSMSFEVEKEIKDIKNYVGKTWYTGRKGPYYRREFTITDDTGTLYLKGASHSILFDLTDRSVYRQKELPFKSFKEISEFVIDAEPRFKEEHYFTQMTKEIKVLNSYLDPIGHVNNLRYTEFVYNAFSGVEVENIGKISRFDFYFQNELKKDDVFIINKAIENNKVIFEIYNTKANKKAFSLVYTVLKE